jgi:hypothetical protein
LQKFSNWNADPDPEVYPDPKHWWMFPKNHLKNFVLGGRLRKHKNICKNIGAKQKFSRKRKLSAKTKIYHEIFRESGNFAKTIPGTKICRESENVCETKFRKSERIFAFFAFLEKEKGVFVSTLVSMNYIYTLSIIKNFNGISMRHNQ